MTLKIFWRGISITFLSAVLAAPARADDKPVTIVIVFAATTLAATAVIVTLASVHHRHKTVMITGCVIGEEGMTLTDEQDGQSYVLSGNTTAIKPGDRMSVQGKKAKGHSKTPVWETEAVIRDFGVCHP